LALLVLGPPTALRKLDAGPFVPARFAFPMFPVMYCCVFPVCFNYCFIAVLDRLKVCIVALLSGASFLVVSSGGSHIVSLSIFGQLKALEC